MLGLDMSSDALSTAGTDSGSRARPISLLSFPPKQRSLPSCVAIYSRPPATAMLSQTGAASSLYSASFLPVAVEAAQRMPPIRPSYALAKSSSGNATGVPATNKTSPAIAIALPVSGMLALQRSSAERLAAAFFFFGAGISTAPIFARSPANSV